VQTLSLISCMGAKSPVSGRHTGISSGAQSSEVGIEGIYGDMQCPCEVGRHEGRATRAVGLVGAQIIEEFLSRLTPCCLSIRQVKVLKPLHNGSMH
jgi:hypothetical protein